MVVGFLAWWLLSLFRLGATRSILIRGPVCCPYPAILLTGTYAILDGLKMRFDRRCTLMTERSVAMDRQHIPTRLVQHPQFSVSFPLEPAAVQDTSEIKGEACGTRFR